MQRVRDRLQVVAHRIATVYRINAQNRKLEWLLSDNEVRDLIFSNCGYCGAEPSSVFLMGQHRDESFLYNGIDRLNNTDGYYLGNVVSCCAVCNKAKGKMQVKEFYRWIFTIRPIWY